MRQPGPCVERRIRQRAGARSPQRESPLCKGNADEHSVARPKARLRPAALLTARPIAPTVFARHGSWEAPTILPSRKGPMNQPKSCTLSVER
jgi:hypothetical protein